MSPPPCRWQASENKPLSFPSAPASGALAFAAAGSRTCFWLHGQVRSQCRENPPPDTGPPGGPESRRPCVRGVRCWPCDYTCASNRDKSQRLLGRAEWATPTPQKGSLVCTSTFTGRRGLGVPPPPRCWVGLALTALHFGDELQMAIFSRSFNSDSKSRKIFCSFCLLF